MVKMKKWWLVILVLLMTIPVLAQVKKTPTAKPSPTPIKWFRKIAPVQAGWRLENIRWAGQDGKERVVLDLHYLNGKTGYTHALSYQSYPFRLVLEVKGVGKGQQAYQEYHSSSLIRGIGYLPSYNDNLTKLVLELKADVQYKVFDLKSPNRIVIDLRPGTANSNQPEAYSIRSGMYTTDIGYRYYAYLTKHDSKTRLLHTKNGQLILEEGYYSSLNEANHHKAILSKDKALAGCKWIIERRGIVDLPEVLY